MTTPSNKPQPPIKLVRARRAKPTASKTPPPRPPFTLYIPNDVRVTNWNIRVNE